MRNPTSPEGVQEWCCELPLVGERRLTDDEERELREEAKNSGRRAWSRSCATFLIPVFAIAFAAAITEWVSQNEIVQGALAVLVILCVILFPAIFFLRANDFHRVHRAAKKDLNERRIKIYQAIPAELWDYAPPEEDAEHDDENHSMQLGGIEVSPDETVTLEVFAASRRLWSVNGQRAQGLTELSASQVATVPQQARVAKAWAQPAVKLGEGHYDISDATRRDLSSSERDELERNARSIWRRPLLPALGFTAWIALPLLFYWTDAAPVKLAPTMYFIGGIALWCDYVLLQKVLLARRWSRDAKGGFAYVFQMPPDDAVDSAGNTLLELLPHSQSLWTVNGMPAPWRMES